MMKKCSFKKISIVLLILLFFFIAGVLFLFCFISFELVGNNSVKIGYQDFYLEEGASVRLFGIDLSNRIQIDGEVVDGVIGKYEITYSYPLVFFPLVKKRIVEVVDNNKPVIELKGETEISICPNANYQEDGYTAYDDVDGDLTNKVQVIEEGNSFKYKVVDSSSNSFVVERKITKEDKQKPTIYLRGDNTMYLKIGQVFEEPGYEVNDNCDQNLTEKVKVEGQVDTMNVGTYTLVYSVSDLVGNKYEVKRNIIVMDEDEYQKNNTGVIYLTFDDGPSAKTTAKILDVLKKEQIKATFFVTGSGPDSLIKRMDDEGHKVALHTYSHQYQAIYKSVDAYFADLEKIRLRVKNITGKESKIIRFPGGSNNTIANRYSVGLMPILKEKVLEKGYSYFDWNVDASDAYNCAKSSVKNKQQCVYNNVINHLSKKRNNIVLMHDIKSYTADVLSKIIQTAKKKGYQFEVLSEDMPVVRFS